MTRFYVPIVNSQRKCPSFNGITTISNFGGYWLCGRSDVVNLVFRDLTQIGKNGCSSMFSQCTALTSVTFEKLQSIIDSSGADSIFENNRALVSASFPALETIGHTHPSGGYDQGGLTGAFSRCSSLSTIEFPVLRELYNYEALRSVVAYCTALTSVSFPALSVIGADTGESNLYGSYALRYAFSDCTNLEHIYFPALTPSSFSSTVQDPFDDMLLRTGTTKVHTIHFRYDMEEKVSSFASYPLYGGTTGYVVVAFDLPFGKINFYITGTQNTPIIYVDGKLYQNNSEIGRGTRQYMILVDNKVLLGEITVTGTHVVAINLEETTFNTITIAPDIEAVNVMFNIDTIAISPTSTSGNNSILSVYSTLTSKNMTYTASKAKYVTQTNSLTFSGADITENIVMEREPTSCTIELTPGLTSYGWQVSTSTNPKAADNWSMYQSTNHNIGNSYSVMKVIITGYETFTCYINSYAESNYDYTIASTIDAATYPTVYNGATQFANTRGFQKDPTTFGTSNYKTVTYTGLGGTEHFFYIVYRKDGSVNSNLDRGYLLIDENQ